MKENDRVFIHVQGPETTFTFTPAISKALDTLYAEVEQIWAHDGPAGHNQEYRLTLRVSWEDLRKEINVGQYVCVCGRLHSGKTGWVVQIEDNQVSIVSKKIEGKIPQYLKDSDDAIESFKALANFLEITEEPAVFHYRCKPESGPLPPRTY
ncbi:hypothetical protein CVT25_002553 [Psilocybe cyanescens]|uniref:Uncharacterized protein n=1 Tax=Psilocybe cyanescens TaxID=93625 RepID=A0A409XWE4_PSICY|nr:hypothetical protein CVT25_002553 [Psilocybe cyanescens]